MFLALSPPNPLPPHARAGVDRGRRVVVRALGVGMTALAGGAVWVDEARPIYSFGVFPFLPALKLGERFAPDVALVPIGGHFTMDPEKAAWAVGALIRPKLVIPMHYGANPLARGTARQFVDAMKNPAVTVRVATPGEAIVLPP